ncbi:hypothetical protein CLBKND_04896 [Methylorubrum aminovorans]
MCAPFSQADQPEPAVSSLDIQESAEAACKAIMHMAKLADDVGIRGVTAEAFGERRVQGAETIRIRFEEMLIQFRAACVGAALNAPAPQYASETTLATVMPARLRRNGEIEAARARAIEAATDAALVSARIARGAALAADLASLDANHPYGKSAEPKVVPVSHEAGFVSPAAA